VPERALGRVPRQLDDFAVGRAAHALEEDGHGRHAGLRWFAALRPHEEEADQQEEYGDR